MNSCVLMVKVISNPELRYTQEQVEIAQMLVEFQGGKPEDPPSTLKVVGWRNLATQIKETCHEGDRLIIEGRLSMTTFDRPEGFKEKRAELVASHVYSLDGDANTLTSHTPSSNVVSMDSFKSTPTPSTSYQTESYELTAPVPNTKASDTTGEDFDTIPF
ncbi:single-stranded DNA-binding protein [Aphanothece sacrum]|uniref:Single-stranded DNA-binding protein n=1 Tax=Aphanothece sacrum FPU1 TaxID=1920663 RepID=A0A401ILY2_APHSA|nr:single-stranded DNA-binding protein [Aphanothece sacrum]GBF82259.1 single-stranded DNA-binding protein [Aphanothece sacrum FPU1]GBF87203.1 single-stranded DNA-binding protein [Aphanothece sacrum FPU3]